MLSKIKLRIKNNAVMLFIAVQMILFMFAFMHAGKIFYAQKVKKESERVNEIGIQIVNKIEKDIGMNISAIELMEYYFIEDKAISLEKFNSTAKYYMEKLPNIVYVQHKNKDTVTDMVYPIEGNENLIGRSLIERAEVEKAVEEAIRERKVTVNDPYDLKYIDREIKGLVIRCPIFKNGDFEGFLVCVMDLDVYLHDTLKAYLRNYNITIYDSEGRLFYENGMEHSNPAYEQKIQIENHEWSIKVSGSKIGMDIVHRNMIFHAIAAAALFVLFLAMQLKIMNKNKNISELKRLRKELQRKEERYTRAVDGVNDVIWEFDIENEEFFISDNWTRITGRSIDVRGNLLEQLKEQLHPADIKNSLKVFRDAKYGRADSYSHDFRVSHALGGYKWMHIRGQSYRDELGAVIKVAGSIADITKKKESEEYVRYIAKHDELTGLLNRRSGIEALESNIDLETDCAVIFVDIDNFKRINDTLGHGFGDNILVQISIRFKELGSRFRQVTLSRFGGDEFLFIVYDLLDKECKLGDICNMILDEIRHPFNIDGKHIYITASMGIAVYPDDGEDKITLLKNADAAMYSAKETGKNRYQFFNSTIGEEISRKADIEINLRHAVELGEFELHYQPQHSLKDDAITGFEALLRWENAQLGRVSPLEFIKVAEETGQIIEIGRWVFEEALEKVKQMCNSSSECKKIGINISATELEEESFVDNIKAKIAKYGVDFSKNIEIEITENVLMKDFERNSKILSELSTMGFKIALDDFGTGYSSFSYLQSLPVDTLKIDKAFIDNINVSEKGTSIVEGIIRLAHSMKMNVIAEGVEDKDKLEFLKRAGCDIVQGYYYSKPMKEDELESYIEMNN
ncbi:PAS domain S-box-containing protein/diguanylate cyclase (GGDEF) domain-containing protein [Peptoclostridium litorale DSM 5388]|uniref:Diguanylate cyclase/phosphodiesterase n=1 Tax=Peptoclostridium litorale DSM 5388 TaxID=1121324 RepID=A0A069RHT9_PEPLI|nr:EAL domain-containing protein [Peptoclostridium litorale]KDR95705.1 diguanylate cyclase/phosphodiesterase [Peptoclostridium litorale DSM 5388]SIO01531.1 PAS domain S-box-containing protein/diguanylate cyclase (GGDEF) domain-containing protein [Peptoclostridium litorale DSM 5388]